MSAQDIFTLSRSERLVADALGDLKLATNQLRAARKTLKMCTHPAYYIEDYIWEHDNGYGRQTKITGKCCTLCLKLQRWPQSNTWSD